jgi:hypothetical protein
VKYVGYKLGFRGTKGGMTLFHIRYVKVGKTLVLLGIIDVTNCG